MTDFKTFGAVSALVIYSATGALAQNAAPAQCGDLPAGNWAQQSADMSDVVTASEAFEVVSIAPLGQTIVTGFTLSEPADLRLEAQGGMGGDTVIELFDESGASLMADDDSGGNGDSRIEIGLDAGTYCLQTSSYNEGVLAATIRIGRMEHEPLTEGVMTSGGTGASMSEDEMCSASTVEMIISPDAEGRFDAVEYDIIPDQDPFLWLNVMAQAPIMLEANNSDADPTMTLYSAEGEFIDENDDTDGLNSLLALSDGLEPGTYCVILDALNDGSLPITFRASSLDPKAMAMRGYDAGTQVPPLDGSYPVEDLGVLGARLRSDVQIGTAAHWFTFTLNEHALAVIEAVGGDSIDPAVEVFDDLGRSVAYNDDYGSDDGGLNALAFAELKPGTYMIALTTLDEVEGTVRVAVRKYLPATQ